MHRRLPLLLFLAFTAFFWVADKGAYKGYFEDDDLDNLSLSREILLPDYLISTLTPRVFDNNFRPVGLFFYRMMAEAAGLNFTPYIAMLTVLHLANLILLWLILRRMGVGEWATAAGCLFWGFHMASFDVFWKPMYVFDLLCGLFCLLSLLAYMNGRWILSLLALCLAYRSKEVAVMLPAVLAAYELLIGERRWKRLIPFFAFSLLMGLQALTINQKPDSAYTLHFDPISIWTCIQFYAARVFLLPFAGFAICLAVLSRDRRVWFGVLGFCLLLVPMLVLPGRLFSPYLYVPLMALGIAVAALADKRGIAAFAAVLVLWVPWNYLNLRWQRNAALADADPRRAVVHRLIEFSRKNPDVHNFIGTSGPINYYGLHGALKLTHPLSTPIEFSMADTPEATEALKKSPVALLNWDRKKRDLGIVLKRHDTPDTPYIRMGMDTPLWQLGEGWYEADMGFRWTKSSDATARLRRPEGASRFELVVNVGDEYIQTLKKSRVTVSLNSTIAGAADFTEPGYHTAHWDIPPSSAGPVSVTIHTQPEFRGGRSLGIAVVSFGFLP